MIAFLQRHHQAHHSVHCLACAAYVVLFILHIPLHALGLEGGMLDAVLPQLQALVVSTR